MNVGAVVDKVFKTYHHISLLEVLEKKSMAEAETACLDSVETLLIKDCIEPFFPDMSIYPGRNIDDFPHYIYTKKGLKMRNSVFYYFYRKIRNITS